MVPAGAVITGRIFSQNLVSLSRRRFLSTERSGGGCSARDKKKSHGNKKERIQKNDRKGTGAGLAAGIKLKNNTQQNEDAAQIARGNK